jgi:Icc-related predicted phosphoesterase
MKLLIIGDLHGRKPNIKNQNFDAIVLVGDICDDIKIGPLYKKYFRLLKKSDFNLGFDDFAKMQVGKKNLEKYEKESLEVGNTILKYLDSFKKPIFMVAGNWDQSYGKTRIKNLDKNYYNKMKFFYESWRLGDKLNPKLIKKTKNIKNCMLHCEECNGVNFIGYGLSSGPEKIRKKETNKKQYDSLLKSHKRLVDKLENVYKNRKNKKLPTFFITHNIPYNTKLDVVKDKKSYAYNKHLGSIIARNFCIKNKPIVCVGGHVHEGKGKDKIGKTLVINPGYGPKAQVLIEIDGERVKIL